MDFTNEELVRVFTALGADDPEGWAESQTEEGIPQLHRFLFLAKAWSQIPDERDHGWIDSDIQSYEKEPTAPFAGSGLALKRLRALGAQDADLTELVRAKMAELLFHVSYVLADSGYVPDGRYEDAKIKPILDRVNWRLVATDDDGQPTEAVDSLHESVLETDPMQREVAPPE